MSSVEGQCMLEAMRDLLYSDLQLQQQKCLLILLGHVNILMYLMDGCRQEYFQEALFTI